MLCEASRRVTASLKNAAEARRQHRNESDPDKKHTYLQMEQCWYRLADGYALMERPEDLTRSARPSATGASALGADTV
jgi:hypothetical protein